MSHAGEDQVGATVALSTREAIRRSAGYQLGNEDDSLFLIRIVSVDQGSNGDNVASSLAIAYLATNLIPYDKNNPQTWLPMLLMLEVRSVGRIRASDIGSGILATLDKQVESYKASVRSQ